MSNIAIKGATTGTGVFTLESPATNTDRTLVLPDEAGTVLTTAGVPSSAMPAGSVLQVVNFVTTDRGSVIATSGASTTLPSPNIGTAITPVGNNSKFLVQVRWNGEATYGGQWNAGWNILRDGNRINSSGNDTWDSIQAFTLNYPSSDNDSTGEGMTTFVLDTTGSTSGVSTTYQLAISNNMGAPLTVFTNRCFNESTADGASGYENWSSEMIITEIAG